jgi:hypothetical protein
MATSNTHIQGDYTMITADTAKRLELESTKIRKEMNNTTAEIEVLNVRYNCLQTRLIEVEDVLLTPFYVSTGQLTTY